MNCVTMPEFSEIKALKNVHENYMRECTMNEWINGRGSLRCDGS